MGLRQPGFMDSLGVHKFISGGASLAAGAPGSIIQNRCLTGWLRNFPASCCADNSTRKSGRPNGARHPVAFLLPQKAGALATHSEAQGAGAAVLKMASGINIVGTSAGVAEAAAALQLVVSASASAAGTSTATGTLIGALFMSGESESVATAAADITALAWAVGVAAGVSTATLTSYATGKLVGEVKPYTELSPESLAASLWNSVAASYTATGTMGEKLNDAGSATNPWTEVIDGSYTAEQILKIVAATLGGKVSGGGTTEIKFRDLSDTKDVITATVDGDGNRTVVAVDV